MRVIQVLNIVEQKGWDNPQRGRVYSPEGISPALNTVGGGGLEVKIITNNMEKEQKKIRIRKLTPKECFRLMGVEDKDIDKIQKSGLSNSAQYKLAGNSIVVDVLYHLFRKMFVETHNESQQLTLF